MSKNIPRVEPPYTIKEGYLAIQINEDCSRKLCNFVPYIVSEESYDDGINVKTHLRIGAVHSDGRVLPEITINGTDFSNISNWVLEHWGAEAVIEPGGRVKEQVRHAIQLTAMDPEVIKTTFFCHTGWRCIDGQWQFLMPASPDDVEPEVNVVLQDKLSNYFFEHQYSKEDVENFFIIEQYPPAKKEIVLPLIAYAFLSPINHFLREAGCEPKFLLFLNGKTGTQKSTLSALFLSLFGRFTSSADLPMSFKDTANSIVRKAYDQKDILTCVDDFHPTRSSYEDNKLRATLQAVMRAYGDRMGRGRLRPDSTLLDSRPPQGNTLVTLEYIPDLAESDLARFFTLEFHEQDVDIDNLTAFQKAAEQGVFRRCMYGFTCWIRDIFLLDSKSKKEFINDLQEELESSRYFFRQATPNLHMRIYENYAFLKLGYHYYLRFLRDMDIIDDDSVGHRLKEFANIAGEIAIQQNRRINEESTTKLFIQKFFSLLDNEAIYVVARGEDFNPADSSFVGFEDEEYFYLNRENTIKAIKKACKEEDTNFSFPAKVILKALADDSLIDTFINQKGQKEYTKQIKIRKKPRRLILLRKKEAYQVAGVVDQE